MVTIKFKNLGDFPAFLNFRVSVLEEFDPDSYHASDNMSPIKSVTSRRVNFLNEKLKDFNAVYIWNDYTHIGSPSRVLEFSSEEDYTHFILKWS